MGALNFIRCYLQIAILFTKVLYPLQLAGESWGKVLFDLFH